jgi:hypothetical protein
MRIHESVTEGGSVAAGAPMAPMLWRGASGAGGSDCTERAAREQHE